MTIFGSQILMEADMLEFNLTIKFGVLVYFNVI